MNRYNQGFGGFGLMEQCKDGKWCKVEEVTREANSREIAYFKSVESYNNLDNSYCTQAVELYHLQLTLLGYKLIAIATSAAFLTLLGVNLYANCF